MPCGSVHSPMRTRPFFPEIFDLAKLSAGAAIGAAEHALGGQSAFSLMRPPGHHTERNRVMGFCYLNNIAIAVAKALHSSSRVRRAAILDFDCHHGNGTEDISGATKGCCLSRCINPRAIPHRPHDARQLPQLSTAAGTRPEQFLATLDEGLNRIRNFQPDLLAVSAGFDSYKDDPITSMDLEIETFYEIGRRIADVALPAPNAPALRVLLYWKAATPVSSRGVWRPS